MQYSHPPLPRVSARRRGSLHLPPLPRSHVRVVCLQQSALDPVDGVDGLYVRALGVSDSGGYPEGPPTYLRSTYISNSLWFRAAPNCHCSHSLAGPWLSGQGEQTVRSGGRRTSLPSVFDSPRQSFSRRQSARHMVMSGLGQRTPEGSVAPCRACVMTSSVAVSRVGRSWTLLWQAGGAAARGDSPFKAAVQYSMSCRMKSWARVYPGPKANPEAAWPKAQLCSWRNRVAKIEVFHGRLR